MGSDDIDPAEGAPRGRPTIRVVEPPPSRQIGIMVASILTTVSSVYPAFLAGALGFELRQALDLSAGTFGLLIAGFFLGSALGSVALGRVGEWIGARLAIVASLLTTAAVTGAIAAFARSAAAMVAALVIAGLANSSAQPAANKLLSQSIDPRRLGFAMAVKQSGMPGATLLGGLAVPGIALWAGWPWTYVAAMILALVSIPVVMRFAPDDSPGSRPPSERRPPDPRPLRRHGMEVARPRSGRSGRSGSDGEGLTTRTPVLALAAVAAGFSAAAAGTLGNWVTSSAVDSGWSTGAAGLLLSLGSLTGIASRLVLGWAADRSNRSPMSTAAGYLALGALGALLLAPRVTWTHAIAVVTAFGAGWAWPALFNFAIVRANPGAAATATGVTQTGVYIGVFTGPLLMGILVDVWGYPVGWTVIAASMLIGASIMSLLARRVVPPAVPATPDVPVAPQ